MGGLGEGVKNDTSLCVGHISVVAVKNDSFNRILAGFYMTVRIVIASKVSETPEADKKKY